MIINGTTRVTSGKGKHLKKSTIISGGGYGSDAYGGDDWKYLTVESRASVSSLKIICNSGDVCYLTVGDRFRLKNLECNGICYVNADYLPQVVYIPDALGANCYNWYSNLFPSWIVVSFQVLFLIYVKVFKDIDDDCNTFLKIKVKNRNKMSKKTSVKEVIEKIDQLTHTSDYFPINDEKIETFYKKAIFDAINNTNEELTIANSDGYSTSDVDGNCSDNYNYGKVAMTTLTGNKPNVMIMSSLATSEMPMQLIDIIWSYLYTSRDDIDSYLTNDKKYKKGKKGKKDKKDDDLILSQNTIFECQSYINTYSNYVTSEILEKLVAESNYKKIGVCYLSCICFMFLLTWLLIAIEFSDWIDSCVMLENSNDDYKYCSVNNNGNYNIYYKLTGWYEYLMLVSFWLNNPLLMKHFSSLIFIAFTLDKIVGGPKGNCQTKVGTIKFVFRMGMVVVVAFFGVICFMHIIAGIIFYVYLYLIIIFLIKYAPKIDEKLGLKEIVASVIKFRKKVRLNSNNNGRTKHGHHHVPDVSTQFEISKTPKRSTSKKPSIDDDTSDRKNINEKNFPEDTSILTMNEWGKRIFILVLVCWIFVNVHYFIVENFLLRAMYGIANKNFENVYVDALKYSFTNIGDESFCNNANVVLFPQIICWKSIIIWINWWIV